MLERYNPKIIKVRKKMKVGIKYYVSRMVSTMNVPPGFALAIQQATSCDYKSLHLFEYEPWYYPVLSFSPLLWITLRYHLSMDLYTWQKSYFIIPS